MTYNYLWDSNVVNWVKWTRTNVYDFGSTNLNPRRWPCISWWYYITSHMAYHRILLYFGVKKQFSAKISLFPTFSVFSKNFLDNRGLSIYWLISFMYLHRLYKYFNFLFRGRDWWFYISLFVDKPIKGKHCCCVYFCQ